MTITADAATAPPSPVILFDAECVLCSANAKFILERDRNEWFRLASVQSDIGRFLYRKHGMDPADPVSLLVVEGERMRQDSDAVLFIYEKLGPPWSVARIFRIVPRPLRDRIYRFIARHRYRVFGRRDSCWIAPEKYRHRIL